MEERKQEIEQKDFSKALRELKEKLDNWRKEKNLSHEDLKSIISQMKDPINKLIAHKILLGSHDT